MLLWACEAFAEPDDVLNAPGGCPFEDSDDVQSFIDQASDILFQLSGGRVHGLCTSTVYPTTNQSCFGLDRHQGSGSPFYLDGYLGGTVYTHHYPGISDQFGGKIPVVLGDDETVVLEVKIDGVVLAHDQYILANRRYLLRRVGSWPVMNDLFQASGLGTWSITMEYGHHPDVITRDATVQVAIELAKTYGIGADKSLGPGVIAANVQGVQVTIEDLADAVAAGRLQIPTLDRWMAIYAPQGRQTADVYSPEQFPYDLTQVVHYS